MFGKELYEGLKWRRAPVNSYWPWGASPIPIPYQYEYNGYPNSILYFGIWGFYRPSHPIWSNLSDQSLEKVKWPSGLQNLTFGQAFQPKGGESLESFFFNFLLMVNVVIDV